MPKHLEEEWGDKNERYLNYLAQICSDNADKHERAGYVFKAKNTTWGLPMVLIPIIMSPISLMINNEKASMYINAIAFLATGVVTGVYSFFKFGEKMSNHFNFSGKYEDVVSDIELEMSRGREFRTPLDVFFTKIHMRTDNLAGSAPILPKGIALDKKYTAVATEV
jgi:hypothetical protein